VQINPEQWTVLSRLLDQALDVPIGRLEQWLATLPPAEAIHRSKLRELLRRRAVIETGDFLLTLPKVAPASAETAAVGPESGGVIGPYVIEEEIGRGGMGAVWRARRSDGIIKRPVALKLPHAGPHSHEFIERFTRERDILGELSHPNIARLDDAGITASGQPFLALEYVPGRPLTDYCDDLRLNVRERLKLFQQVLRAVQYAHGHLVIHRDLKPSNIIVTPQGQAMLVDFGIAKVIPDDGCDSGTRTQLCAPALTPEYASPEQIAGKAVSTASDIYSLGVLLFELLTGERPYRRLSTWSLSVRVRSCAAPVPLQRARPLSGSCRACSAETWIRLSSRPSGRPRASGMQPPMRFRGISNITCAAGLSVHEPTARGTGCPGSSAATGCRWLRCQVPPWRSSQPWR
jgi:serine/threonine protein kinase